MSETDAERIERLKWLAEYIADSVYLPNGISDRQEHSTNILWLLARLEKAERCVRSARNLIDIAYPQIGSMTCAAEMIDALSVYENSPAGAEAGEGT